MKLPVIDYVYVDEDIIAEDVIRNCPVPYTEDNILDQVIAYIDSEEESSLVHHLTDNQIEEIRDTVAWTLSYKGYKVV